IKLSSSQKNFQNIVSDVPLKFPFGAKFCFSFLALFNFQGASRRFRDSLIRILQTKLKVKNFFQNSLSFV
ncbi:MAG: hypothetical protein J6U19_04945, partial [Oscillospiraceae bacterium]|nr:hypothetical protein [Oscillospiraceae bacterium]